MGMALFHHHNLIRKFKIPDLQLHNFLTIIEQGYHKENPYHNAIHAADVAQTLSYFMVNCLKGCINQKTSLWILDDTVLTDTELFAGIVAALIHDFDHPGVNNTFLVRTQSHKALVYNDISVSTIFGKIHSLGFGKSPLCCSICSDIRRGRQHSS